jgi:pimeloyl-ACP methyl ester carboxylesterase/nicotinamidase-related amidase
MDVNSPHQTLSFKRRTIMKTNTKQWTLITVALVVAIISHNALAQLPDPGMTIDPARTALLVTDPQNDFLSPEGVTWGIVGKSVQDNNTVENIDRLFAVAKKAGLPVFVSPHYYYPTDHGWKFEGALEKLMHNIGMFDRKGALSLEQFEGSGADWLQRYKKYIEDGDTVIVSPHKVYGPETNDLVLQLRKRRIDKVILAGMSANLCTESHMRELIEQGFEVAVVSDATAAAVVPDGDGYASAMTNFRFIANTVWSTDEAVKRVRQAVPPTRVQHRTLNIDGLDIFYREAGQRGNPTVLLLHGFPTSSHMFRNLIPKLAGRYHVVAPDYPGFGGSSMPTVDEFDYTFDRLAEIVDQFTERLNISRYSLYVMDYGAPVGFRLATKHPERIQSIVVQNGNAYDEGLREFWDPIKTYWKRRTAKNAEPLRGLLTLEATKWQYLTGVRNPEVISPENWEHVQPLLDRPGNSEIQLALFYDYGSNPSHYPKWQRYFRQHQPPTLIVWGKNDPIFPAEGAYPYRRDLQDLGFHILDTGHFALEEDGDLIADLMLSFLDRKVKQRAQAQAQLK